MKNPIEFLKKKYTTLESGKGVSKYLEQLERIMKTERKDKEGRVVGTGADLLEHMIMKDFTLDIKDSDLVLKLAKDLYESEKRVAIERGHGAQVEGIDLNDAEILGKYKNAIYEKYENQKQTLSSWLHYLRESNDYPLWFKYYTIRGLRDMGQFNRHDVEIDIVNKQGEQEVKTITGPSYSARTIDTIAPFPELNSESLGFVRKSVELQMEIDGFTIPQEIDQDIVKNTVLDTETEQKINEKSKPEFIGLARQGALKNIRNKKRSEYIQGHKNELVDNFIKQYPVDENRKDTLTEEFSNRLHTTDFAKLYAFAQVETAGSMNRESIEGAWVKYPKGSDYTILENALHGKGTGWCTATGSAKGHVESGDFYVYFTKNKSGINTEPRVAIRMENDQIGEIRGVNTRQELEPELVDIAKQKYQDLPGAQKYEQADYDMRLMTSIYKKVFAIDKDTKQKIDLKPELSKQELVFIYEIDRKVESFGYDPDPRITEVRSTRNPIDDAPIVFDCASDQIASNSSEITAGTKAYIGELEKGIFEKLVNVEHVYRSFPDKKIQYLQLDPTIEYPNSVKEWKKELDKKQIKQESGTEDMLEKMKTSELSPNQKFVILTVADLGFTESARYDAICKKAESLGLELCAQDDGPKIRLAYSDQPRGTYLRTAMKSIDFSGGDARLWNVYRDDDGAQWLDWDNGGADYAWYTRRQFAFRVRKS